MLFKPVVIFTVLCVALFGVLEALESEDSSGYDDYVKKSPHENDYNKNDDDDMIYDDRSGDGLGDPTVDLPLVNISVNIRQPPAAVGNEAPVDAEHENNVNEGLNDDKEDGEGGGGGGFSFGKGNSEPYESDDKAPMPPKENDLIKHPAILTAIITGGILVLVSLVVFFVLVVCCIRKKDEGSYDLDEAMKQKLKYITYTKADTSDKEFFA